MRIHKRWMLVLLVATGQLVLLIPGTIWLVSWLNHASRDIVEQRLNAATTRLLSSTGKFVAQPLRPP